MPETANFNPREPQYGTRTDVYESVERILADPQVEAVTLESGETVRLGSQAHLQTSPESAHSLHAILRIPRSDEEDPSEGLGHLIIGHHETEGYYLAAPKSDYTLLTSTRERPEDAANIAKVPWPLTHGDTLTIGRNGLEIRNPNAKTLALESGSPIFKLFREEMGMATSRAHLKIEVQSGEIKITDLSPNQTQVIKRQSGLA